MDPLTVLGTAALTQAVTFLFGQVKDLLERRRSRAKAAGGKGEPVVVQGGGEGVLDGRLKPASIDPGVLEDAASGLKVLSGVLEDFADGVKPVAVESPELLGAVRSAREALEGLYGQSITFRGEQDRAVTGTALTAAEADARVGKIVASGKGAVAAHTISAPVATSGGMAAGGDIKVGPQIGETGGASGRA